MNESRGTMGTFAGVFTPSILTILGIILFRRMGFVVGASGLATTLVILGLANLISVLTSFSLAAIATNMKVKSGGDYYLISRTLGKEFGGAIGLVLFFAQAVSIGFYCIGFGEAVAGLSWGRDLPPQMVAGAALILLFALAWVGADLATKFQFGVMGLMVLALFSFFLGGIQNWDASLLAGNWQADGDGLPFWTVFAIFFPAVTGFTQGVSMSGDLADPGESLPRGTFLAVGVSIAVYLAAAVIFAATSPLDRLATDYGVMGDTAAWPGLIGAGVIAATLSSAMASFLGAPRILQSLAGDKVIKLLTPFARGYGKAGNPRRGVLLALGISGLVVALGELDLVARIVSMFFLISYGLLNYATYYEAAAQSPSFRPRFRWYHQSLSLAGSLACLGIMMAIDLKTGLAASALMVALYQYLKRIREPSRWADSHRSHHLQQIRTSLLAAGKDPAHAREWRPFILALSAGQDQVTALLTFSGLLEGRSGITTVVRLLRAGGFRGHRLRDRHLAALKDALAAENRSAFPLALSSPDSETALFTLFQSYGIGPVKANTVLLSWNETRPDAEKDDTVADYGSHLRQVLLTGCNLVLLHGDARGMTPESTARIDVWWSGDDSSRLSLLLAYLVTRRPQWESAAIRLLATNYDRENKETKAELADILSDFRIPAEPRIVIGADHGDIKRLSADADLTFLPVSVENLHPLVFGKFPWEDILPHLATAAMVTAAAPVDLASDPEQCGDRDLIMLYDDLEAAVRRAEKADKKAVKAAESARKQVKTAMEGDQPVDPETMVKLSQAIRTALKAGDEAEMEKSRKDELTARAREKGIDEETES